MNPGELNAYCKRADQHVANDGTMICGASLKLATRMSNHVTGLMENATSDLIEGYITYEIALNMQADLEKFLAWYRCDDPEEMSALEAAIA